MIELEQSTYNVRWDSEDHALKKIFKASSIS
jgi:hypothetical protein